MAWSWAIYLYLWMAGMAGGAFFAAFLSERFAGITDKKLLKPATIAGIPLAIVGVILLIVELGQPIRFWHLFTEFDVASPMSMGTWILLIWVAIAVIMAILWWAQINILKSTNGGFSSLVNGLCWVELVFSVLLIAYTGVLLAVSSQPLWANTALLPALFVASAVSTGVALVILIALFRGSISNRIIGRLAEADAIVIIIELVVMIGFIIWLATSDLMGAGDALGILISGTLAVPFWLGVVLVALLIPLGLEITNWGKDLGKKAVWRAIMASSTCVVLGGLVLRAVMVVGGQL